MTDFQPSRQQSDLADVIEMLLDKGVVINADIAVSIGDTQLLGVQIRAAIASFETAAKYGLEFPEGTDMQRLAAAVDEPELVAREKRRNLAVDPTRGVNVSPDPDSTDEEAESGTDGERESGDESGTDGGSESDDESGERGTDRLGARPDPEVPVEDGDVGSSLAAIGGDEDAGGSKETEGEGDADEGEGRAPESDGDESEDAAPESKGDETPNESSESDDETAEPTAEENE